MTAIALETKSASELENKLAGKLKEMYEGASHGQKSTMAHLFALRHAKELDKLDGAAKKRIANNATGVPSFESEFNKMINLSEYVEVTEQMTVIKLENKLKRMIENAPEDNKVTMIHLFALLYANELNKLDGATKERIAAKAAGHSSYIAVFNDMIKLAQYVEVKSEIRKEFI